LIGRAGSASFKIDQSGKPVYRYGVWLALALAAKSCSLALPRYPLYASIARIVLLRIDF